MKSKIKCFKKLHSYRTYDAFHSIDNAFDSDPASWIHPPVGETMADFRLDPDFDSAYCQSNSIGSVRLRQ